MSGIVVREPALRWWAAIALLLTVWIAAESHNAETVVSGPRLWRDVVAAAVSVVVLGFYVQMLIECASDKKLPGKWLWFLFLLAMPVVSAFVFFMITRSARSEAPEGNAATASR